MRFVIYATQQPTDDWPLQTSDALFGDQIRLLSYALSSQEITSGDVLQLQLNWQAERQPDADYTVFVQLLDERDQVVAQRDAPPGDRPTSEWQPGEEIIDKHGVLVPHGTAPGDYRLILGMYNPATGERLPVGEQDYIDLGVVRVNRPDTPLPVEALRMQNPKPFRFGEITLLGHDRYKRGYSFNPSEPLRANDLLHLTWYWQANSQPTAAWWFTARLVSGADTEVALGQRPSGQRALPDAELAGRRDRARRARHADPRLRRARPLPAPALPAHRQPGRRHRSGQFGLGDGQRMSEVMNDE